MKSIKGSENQPTNCEAKCLNGKTVSCSGPNCSATDASGTVDGQCSGGGQTNYCQKV
jgi:hypothetical protein